jgi:very-short-patch-repair endonuclease
MCSPTSKKLCGECSTCYNRSFATHPRAIYWSSKNELEPKQVTKSSNKKFYFDCPDCEHELEMSLCNISNGQWCKYCNRDGLCNKNCEFCYKKSFASHPMAIYWSSKNEINPRNILKGANNKCWFDCSKCKHEFESALYSISRGTDCPYCSNQKICNECDYCFKKSCASHEMNEAWSSLNELNPRDIFLQSNKKIKFNCLTCFHEYETTPNHYYNRSGSCPYCANQRLCKDCITCHDKSFASHPLANCWSSKNEVTSRSVFKGAEKKYWFNCDTCDSEFESKMYNVLSGYWCPYCKKKTEAKVLKLLKCKTQLRFDWCRYSKTDNIMPFDFGVDKVLIEVDGDQHFNQVSNWDSPESVQLKDIEKIKKCVENGYSIIHIYQKDIWNDSYDWQAILKEQIKILQTDCKAVFISLTSKYSTHIEQLDCKYEIINPI